MTDDREEETLQPHTPPQKITKTIKTSRPQPRNPEDPLNTQEVVKTQT